jgi:hypothetical protein
MLNFELCVGGTPIIVDTGVSTYESGERRLLERSTESHNTVQLGRLEQSEMWGTFRVGRRARIQGVRTGPDFVEAAHDGFSTVGCAHWRRFELGSSELTIVDELRNEPRRDLMGFARLHFAPGLVVTPTNTGVSVGSLRLMIDGADAIDQESYRYSPSFNVRQDAKLLKISFRDRLTTRFVL